MILSSLLTAASLASVASAALCNGDNCLNAIKAKGATGVSFCSDYTQSRSGQTTPTYIPTTCGAARISSACYCDDNVANPTYTPAPCPTGQVLQNPSFFRPTARNVDIRPWVIAVPSGSPGCIPAGSYSEAYMDTQWGDARSIQCSFDNTVGGKSTVGQDILLCPSTQYTFTIHTACDFLVTNGEGDFNITFRVTLNGNQVIIPTQSACPICANPNSPKYNPNCRQYAAYETASAVFTSPAGTNKNTLYIEVSQPAGLSTLQVPLLMDGIYIDPVGVTDESDPSRFQ